MSYCRWSSDNWKSDLYVYASVGDFYSINVAANRLVGDAPEVPSILTPGLDMEEYTKAYKAQLAWLHKAERVPIELPYAGESFAEDTAADARDRLLMLRELGYHVPQYAIDQLDEEAKEELLGRTV